MAEEKLINKDELNAIHSVLKRIGATGIEDVSGDWLSGIQTTNFEPLMRYLPEIAANTANGKLQTEIGYLSSLLYTIAMYQAEIRQLSVFLEELHKSAFEFIDFNHIEK